MNKKKKKNNKSEGDILVRTVAVSPEEHQRIIDYLTSLECDFSVVIQDSCEIVHLEENYFGPCPHCGEMIHTKDVCPECGTFLKII